MEEKPRWEISPVSCHPKKKCQSNSNAGLRVPLRIFSFLLNSSARLAGINLGGAARGGITGSANSTTASHTDNGPRGDFGLIGLAVMGQNLILNAADHGFNVVAFNRTVSKVDNFLANEAKGKREFLLSFPSFSKPQSTQTMEKRKNRLMRQIQASPLRALTPSRSSSASSRSPAAS